MVRWDVLLKITFLKLTVNLSIPIFKSTLNTFCVLLGLGQGVRKALFILAGSNGVQSVVYELAAATAPGNTLKM